MAKKAAQKGSATKAKEKTKTAKPEAKKASKASPAKPAKVSAKEKAVTEKVARSPKVTSDVDDHEEVSEVAPVPEKAVKAPKVKPERISAAQKKLDRAAAESNAHWTDLHQKHSSEKPQVYDMRGQFEAHKPLQHKVLGWGWVMSVENDRLEVIFEDGKRMLISNYKAR